MVCDYEIFPERRLVFLRLGGECTFTQLKTAIEQLWGDGKFSHAYNGLVDLTDTKIGISSSDFHALMGFVLGQKSTPRGRWAAVSASPLVTAFAMLYQRLSRERHSFGVFSSLGPAAQFIGLSLDDDPPAVVLQLENK